MSQASSPSASGVTVRASGHARPGVSGKTKLKMSNAAAPVDFQPRVDRPYARARKASRKPAAQQAAQIRRYKNHPDRLLDVGQRDGLL